MKTWYRKELYFTQGFTFINNFTMLETSGLHGQSFMHHLILKDSDHSALVDNSLTKTALERNYFGEGNDLMQGQSESERVIYWLTWRSRVIMKYDSQFKHLG